MYRDIAEYYKDIDRSLEKDISFELEKYDEEIYFFKKINSGKSEYEDEGYHARIWKKERYKKEHPQLFDLMILCPNVKKESILLKDIIKEWEKEYTGAEYWIEIIEKFDFMEVYYNEILNTTNGYCNDIEKDVNNPQYKKYPFLFDSKFLLAKSYCKMVKDIYPNNFLWIKKESIISNKISNEWFKKFLTSSYYFEFHKYRFEVNKNFLKRNNYKLN